MPTAHASPHPAVRSVLKRLFDASAAAVGMVLLLPIYALAAAVVLITMGRPVLFLQKRPGLYGKPFTMVKFRTMRPPKPGEVACRTDEQRLTAVGRFLRKTSIDELPELWNVMKGEMSLVGPRPLLIEYLPRYTAEQNRRHHVRPGITGWAQVNGRQNITFSKRLELDLWYVDHWSMLLDLKILLMTGLKVVFGSGVLPGQRVDEVDDLGLSTEITRQG